MVSECAKKEWKAKDWKVKAVCTKEGNPSIKKLDTSSVALKRTGPIQTAAAKTHLSQNLCQNFDFWQKIFCKYF